MIGGERVKTGEKCESSSGIGPLLSHRNSEKRRDIIGFHKNPPDVAVTRRKLRDTILNWKNTVGRRNERLGGGRG